MCVGHEYYQHTETLLQTLEKGATATRVNQKWLQPLFQAYICLFDMPDIGLQLWSHFLRSFARQFSFSRNLDMLAKKKGREQT